MLLSLATVALFAATAKADSYSFESTNSWLNVSKNIVVDTAIDTPTQEPIQLDDLNPTSVRITGAITNLICNASAPADNVFSDSENGLPQASITATSAGWYGWHCTNASAGVWVELTDLDAPTEGYDYLVNIEFSESGVRSGIGAEPTTWSEWQTNAKDFKTIANVGFAGYGTFTNYCGMAVKTVTVIADAEHLPEGMTITSAGDLDTVLEGEGQNGLTKRQTIQLGLPSVTAKPFTAPVQTTDSGKLGFTIGNVVKEAVKGYVTYTVEEYTDAGCTVPTENVSAETPAGDQATMNAVSDGVRYYKIKIKFN